MNEANEINPSGRRRPILVGPDNRNTPVPWLGGIGPKRGEWKYVDFERANQATHDKLCIICGEDRGDNWVYGLLSGRPSDEAAPYASIFGGAPAPTYGHPSCILKAALYCPHLKRQEHPAMTQDKTKLTLEDLKKMAKEEKKSLVMGVGQYGRQHIKA